MISIENISCPSRTDQTFQMGLLKVCFHMVETTKSKAGRNQSQLARAAQTEPCHCCFTAFTLTLRGPDVRPEHLLQPYCGPNEASTPRFLQANGQQSQDPDHHPPTAEQRKLLHLSHLYDSMTAVRGYLEFTALIL